MVCQRCGKNRPSADFYPRKRGGTARTTTCKMCVSKANASYYAKNRAAVLERVKARKLV